MAISATSYTSHSIVELTKHMTKRLTKKVRLGIYAMIAFVLSFAVTPLFKLVGGEGHSTPGVSPVYADDTSPGESGGSPGCPAESSPCCAP